jgi:vanillate O-demethylase monooxygenase subunit
MGEYVRNAWYPAAWSRDVKRELISRRILEEDVVLYRTSAGLPAALEDTCPHRLTPLSMGRLRGDTIECGYHGMTFNYRGECVLVPVMPAQHESFDDVEHSRSPWPHRR